MVDAFHWFVYNFGNTAALSDLSMAGIDGPILDGIIALIVQSVYCWRIWVLSGRRIVLPGIIALVSFLVVRVVLLTARQNNLVRFY